MRIKYPLIVGLVATVIYDYSVYYYGDAPKGHWFSSSSDSLKLSIYRIFFCLDVELLLGK